MINVLGFKIFTDIISKINLDGKIVINTINPHSYCISLDDHIFRNALDDSDILLPDGIGFVYASRILNNKRIKKISGYDLHNFLINVANEKGLKVFI